MPHGIIGRQTLQSISTRLIAGSAPQSLYEQIVDAAVVLMASDAASLQMFAPEHASLTLLAWRNLHPDSAAFWQTVTAGSGSTCGKALEAHERVVVADIDTCEFMAGTQDLEEYRRSGIRSVQSTPLLSRSGHPLGMLSTHWRTPHTPTEDDFGLFDALARQAADLIEHALAESALRESEERFRRIANTAPVMIWITDVNGGVTYVNQTWLDFTGLRSSAAQNDGWMTVIHADDAARSRDVYRAAADHRERFQDEQRLRRHDGEYRWVVSTGVPRFNVDGSFGGYIGTAVDITERKLAADTLATLKQRLIEAHEEERVLLARELHDDISQQLASLSMHLQRLQHNPPDSAATMGTEIEVAAQQTIGIAADIQALSRRLHSSKPETLGLVPAAAGLCEELCDPPRLDIVFKDENIPATLPVGVSLCLFRVLQEALQNAIKHSGARRVQVLLERREDDIELTVDDSGIGFELQTAVKERGLGLTSMKERLVFIGGELSIHSEVGRGTTIHARAPLKPPTEAACA